MAGKKAIGLLLALAVVLGLIRWAGDALRRGQERADLHARFYAAVQAGDTKVVRECLRRGADPNTKGPKGVLMLSWVAQRGDVPTMRALLDAGADPNCRGGWLPALNLAASQGHANAVELLLKRGADPNNNEEGAGSRALEVAVEHGHTRVVRVLLKHGANPNTRSWVPPDSHYRQGSTILASMRKRIGSRPSPIVDLLVKAGARAEGAR